MRPIKALLGLLLALGIAAPAGAVVSTAVWKKVGTDTVTTNVTPGAAVVYDFGIVAPAANTPVDTDVPFFSPVIQTGQCARVTVQFDPDITGTGGTARVHIWSCLGTTPSANNCGKIITDNNVDGYPDDTPLSGEDGAGGNTTPYRYLFDLTGLPFLAVQVTTVANASTQARVMVSCLGVP